jgi:hypothetical protein
MATELMGIEAVLVADYTLCSVVIPAVAAAANWKFGMSLLCCHLLCF